MVQCDLRAKVRADLVDRHGPGRSSPRCAMPAQGQLVFVALVLQRKDRGDTLGGDHEVVVEPAAAVLNGKLEQSIDDLDAVD